MKIIGFRYCDRTKNYFCDKHESDKNVRYREKFIKEYFKYKLDSYRWIHLQSFCDQNKFKRNLSIRRNPSTKPIMMVGQDESIFKQYSFGCKCWVGPGGETQLLPKSDGYSQMVSGFVSRDFGVWLHLNDKELKKVNQQRVSDKWCHYLSADEAMAVYDTTKKKKDNRQTYLDPFL